MILSDEEPLSWRPGAAVPPNRGLTEKVAALEDRVSRLEEELAELKSLLE